MHYMGVMQFLRLQALVGVYGMFGAPMGNLITFMAMPGILSALILFYYGTYVPHKPESTHHDKSFDRPKNFGTLAAHEGRLAAYLKCMNFCCHDEHHANPRLPWWALYDAHLENLRRNEERCKQH